MLPVLERDLPDSFVSMHNEMWPSRICRSIPTGCRTSTTSPPCAPVTEPSCALRIVAGD